jgi:hypothetical protein
LANVAPPVRRRKGKTVFAASLASFRAVNPEVTLALAPRNVSADRFLE